MKKILVEYETTLFYAETVVVPEAFDETKPRDMQSLFGLLSYQNEADCDTVIVSIEPLPTGGGDHVGG
jgi:hypothetical protein